MLKEDTLRLLLQAEGPLSGEGMSRTLGVSRAAVWKAMEALRAEGWGIDSKPGLGYALTRRPDLLTPVELSSAARVVGREVICLETVDSTNNECRRRAAQSVGPCASSNAAQSVGSCVSLNTTPSAELAPDGLTVVSGEQTGGKGRRGRNFQSLDGKGLYLSVLLRPRQSIPLTEVTQITAWAAVAVCKALERVSGLSCAIKWTNDILLGEKKVCGILSELGLDDDGRCDYVVVGIGINLSQTERDFGSELAPIATSLSQHMAQPPRRGDVAVALLDELDALWKVFPDGKKEYLEQYKARCITVGKPVKVLRPDRSYEARALEINEDFSLQVTLPDGTEEKIFTGEVSVRSEPGQ